MEHELTIGLDFFELQYKELSIRCVQGTLNRSLDELAELYADDPIEFAPVKQERNRRLLAGKYIEPPVDVTVDKYLDNRSSVVVSSLDHDKSVEITDDIVKRSGFSVFKPEKDFINCMNQTMLLEIEVYNSSKILAAAAGITFEKAWSISHYANFLGQYKGYPGRVGMRKTLDSFGLGHIKI